MGDHLSRYENAFAAEWPSTLLYSDRLQGDIGLCNADEIFRDWADADADGELENSVQPNLVSSQANMPSMQLPRKQIPAQHVLNSCPHHLTSSQHDFDIPDRKSILAELSVLQARCTALQGLLSEPSAPLQFHCGQSDNHHVTAATDVSDVRDIVDQGEDFVPVEESLDRPAKELELNVNQDTGCHRVLQPLSEHRLSLDGSQAQTTLPNEGSSQQDFRPTNNNNVDEVVPYDFEDVFGLNMYLLPSLQHVDSMAMPSSTSTFLDQGTHGDDAPTVSTNPSTQSVMTSTATTSNNSHHPYHCHNCGMAFRRPSDRDRHALAHNPNAPRFSCPHAGCARIGRRGFLRKDKLTQHQAHMNH